MYKGMIIEKNRVRILFDNVENGLMATAKDLSEFTSPVPIRNFCLPARELKVKQLWCGIRPLKSL